MALSILKTDFKYSHSNVLETNVSNSKAVKDLKKSLGCMHPRKLTHFTRIRARASLHKALILTRMIAQHSENRSILFWIKF